MNKKRREPESSSGNQSFIMLYTCLSLLLLCFFVFLESNSVIDPEKRKEAIGSLIGAFGFFTGGISPTGDVKQRQLGFSKTPLSKDAKILQDIIEIVKRAEINEFILIDSKSNSILMKFKKGIVFKRDDSKISANFLPVLMRIYSRFSSVTDLKINIVCFHKRNFSIAAQRAFNVTSFFNGKGIHYNDINSSGRITDSDTELLLSFSGNVYVKNRASSNTIKEGDFTFTVD